MAQRTLVCVCTTGRGEFSVERILLGAAASHQRHAVGWPAFPSSDHATALLEIGEAPDHLLKCSRVDLVALDDDDTGLPPLLLQASTSQSSCTWAANCRFHSTSSTEGRCDASLARHLWQISMTVLSDSSEHPLLTTGSAKLLLLTRSSSAIAHASCSHIEGGSFS